ncbi:MAG: CRISPR-associated helicase Cas3' [Kiritimatiellia bacterium]
MTNTDPILLAHSSPNSSSGAGQSLQEHSRNTARLCAEFAAAFGAPRIGELIGAVHDLGKASDAFQAYIRRCGDCEEAPGDHFPGHGPDHSTAGARWLDESTALPGLGRFLAYLVAGHHAGLPNGHDDKPSSLERRLDKSHRIEPIGDYQPELPDLQALKGESAKEFGPLCQGSSSPGFSISFALRMLYSCLVDADFLDTEAFMDAARAKARAARPYATLEALAQRLESHYGKLDEGLKADQRWDEPIMAIRREIREDCLVAADSNPGLFSLQVPTGGGKTLAAMHFALRHAIRNNQRRIVLVIPYTTIIEQTAQIYRNIFGSENVLEVHSAVDPEHETSTSKLVAENWSAPIVVTTNVQFFESLLTHRSSKARKLHNLAESVIILDEAQGIPLGTLKPCLMCLKELYTHYRSTIVLSTATLPVFFDKALLKAAALADDSHPVRAIVSPERRLPERMKRAQAVLLKEALTLEELAQKAATERQVLIVVNTRARAKELHALLRTTEPETNCLHLSGNMCGVHRTQVLNRARELLRTGAPCILVSTQLIEAGVDIDFPCVWREIAGVDSIVQAAGRCNREGEIPCGRVVIFQVDGQKALPGELGRTAALGKEVLELEEFQNAPLSPECVEKYFKLSYADRQRTIDLDYLDRHDIQGKLQPRGLQSKEDLFNFMFRDAGECFKLIDEHTTSLIVPFDQESSSLCEALRQAWEPAEQRGIVRKLQRYTISVYGDKGPVDDTGCPIAELVHERYWVLTSPELHYSRDYGLLKTGQTSGLFA